MKAADLSGQVFGHLIAKQRGPNDPHGRATWVCVCQCGDLTTARADNLKTGKVRSCGKCGAFNETGTAPDGIRFRVECWGSDTLPNSTRAIYCWAQATDPSGVLVWRTAKCDWRGQAKGEQHPGATRALKALAKLGLIGEQNNRTFRRWALEEGVVITAHDGGQADTHDAWYRVTGIAPPMSNHERSQQPIVYSDPNPLSPDVQEAVNALLEKWASDD